MRINPSKEFCQVIADTKISYSEQKICKLVATVKENLTALIQRRIKELGISKAELARRAGFSRTYATDLANGTGNTQSGQYNLSPESVSGLSKALEISESEILEAMNYLTGNNHADSHEILKGVTVQFDRSSPITKKGQEKILEIMRITAAGIKAEEEKENE